MKIIRRSVVLLSTLLTITLAGCGSYSPKVESDYAEVFGSYQIVSVDGQKPEFAYSVKVAEGRHSVEALYETYGGDYRCRFELELLAGMRYEIVAHAKKQPLTLYRLAQNQTYWSRRLDPVEALACVKQRPCAKCG